MHYEYSSLAQMVAGAELLMARDSKPIQPLFWQATDVSKAPGSEMREVMFFSGSAPIPRSHLILEDEIRPNMPWAEEHFQERVGRKPVNPGKTWLTWPWSNTADLHRKEEGGKFSHTYFERYWPKLAGNTEVPHRGIRYQYGDLTDVVNLIAKDPTTRQAYFPVFFPEDTGATHGERIPCSIGYHFIIRDKELHCVYQLRSCDLWRHFRDDLYLTARLVQWVQDELCFNHDMLVVPGRLHIFISSLHLFVNDYHSLLARMKKEQK